MTALETWDEGPVDELRTRIADLEAERDAPAKWDAEGEPENVQAAIADALEWLVLLRETFSGRGARLRAAIAALAKYGDAETRALLGKEVPR